MVLVVMINDAISKTMARFYPAETTEAYTDLLRRYLRKRGRMTAMYVDRDRIFRAEDFDPYDPQPTLTQFKRALDELEELILANSPQAKGRVERSRCGRRRYPVSRPTSPGSTSGRPGPPSASMTPSCRRRLRPWRLPGRQRGGTVDRARQRLEAMIVHHLPCNS